MEESTYVLEPGDALVVSPPFWVCQSLSKVRSMMNMGKHTPCGIRTGKDILAPYAPRCNTSNDCSKSEERALEKLLVAGSFSDTRSPAYVKVQRQTYVTYTLGSRAVEWCGHGE